MKQISFFLILLFSFIICTAQDYFPLNKGSYWVYRLYQNGDAIFAGDSMYYLGQKTLNDSLFYRFVESSLEEHSPIGSDTVFLFLNSADKNSVMLSPRYTSNITDSTVYAKHSFVDGNWWIAKNGDTIKEIYVGTITTLAGTFDSCYQLSNGYVFAPEVGIIRKIITDTKSWFDLETYYIAPENDETSVKEMPYNKLIIFPNPASGLIKLKNIKGPYNYQVIDIKNHTIKIGTSTQPEISIADLNKGVYLLKVEALNEVTTQKFIKQ